MSKCYVEKFSFQSAAKWRKDSHRGKGRRVSVRSGGNSTKLDTCENFDNRADEETKERRSQNSTNRNNILPDRATPSL